MIVNKVGSLLTVGGQSYPLQSFGLDLGRNVLPRITATMPMGDAMGAGGMLGQAVNVSNIAEGDEVSLSLTVGNSTFGMSGYVRSASLGVSLSAVSNSSAHFSVTAEDALSRLGGVPVLNRLIVGAGKQKIHNVDPYREQLLQNQKEGTNTAMGYMFTGQLLPDGLRGLANGGSMPGFVIDMLINAYESEDKVDTTAASRSKDKESIELLKALKKNIVGGVLKNDIIGGIKDKSVFLSEMMRNVKKLWGSANALEILIRMLNDVFFCLAPRTDGTVKVRQYCPVYQKEDVEIPNKLILGIDEYFGFDATPTAGIRMRMAGTSYDYYSETVPREYIQYPPAEDKVPGLYRYIDTDQYKMWFVFSSDLTPRKDKSAGGGRKTVSHHKGEHKAERKNADAEPPYETAVEKLHLEVGKAAYALQKWQNSGIVVRIAYDDLVNVGDIVKIDLTKAAALSGNIPKGVYYGYADSVSMAGSSGNLALRVKLTHVRSEDDNKEFGLKELPLYEEPK